MIQGFGGGANFPRKLRLCKEPCIRCGCTLVPYGEYDGISHAAAAMRVVTLRLLQQLVVSVIVVRPTVITIRQPDRHLGLSFASNACIQANLWQ